MQSETTTKPLRDLVQRFSTGLILLPQFQRDYVWRPSKIRNLLDSLFRDLPIGGFYLWQPAGALADPKPKRFGQQRLGGPSAAYLIDGQQRLTSLEAAFGLFSGEDRGGGELRCYLDLSLQSDERRRDTRLFVSYGGNKTIARRIDNGDPTLVDVRTFFDDRVDHQKRVDVEQSLSVLPGWTAKRVALAMARYDQAHRLLNQQVPCTTVQNITDDVAVELFRRLNQGGTALREGDVRAAELARGDAVKVLRRMREFVSGETPGRLGFGFSFAFRALVVFHRGSARFRTLPADWVNAPGPNKRSLADSWSAADRALSDALKFVDNEMGWSLRTLVPSANAIIVLAVALDKARSARRLADADKRYRSWLSLTALRGVFQSSVETTIDRFVRRIRDSSKHPSAALLDGLTRNEARRVDPDELADIAQLWGPATQVFYSWLVQRGARDWLNGESLDSLARSRNIGVPGGDLTVHHIFPRKLAAEYLANPNDANCLANFAIVSRETNSRFKETSPDDVLEFLNADQRQDASVQFFTSDAGDRLKSDRFQEFRLWRAKRLADAFNDELWISRR
jgi:hypothetical protein